MDDDLLRLDDPLVVVLLAGVVVPDGHVKPLDLDIHHAVGCGDDEGVERGENDGDVHDWERSRY